MNYVGEKPADPLTLLLHLAEGSGEATLYDDAGNGFGYEKGEYACRSIFCEVSRDHVSVRLEEREGSFVPERRSLHLELRGVKARPQSVTANGEEAGWRYEEHEGKLTVSLAENAGKTTVEVML